MGRAGENSWAPKGMYWSDLQTTASHNNIRAMSLAFKPGSYKWLHGGEEIFPALLAAIDGAQKTVRLEVYFYANDELGRGFRDALVKAQLRGLSVQVLIDSLGSLGLPANFWEPLAVVGGEARWFNPDLAKRLGFRDHRKILVCDEEIAFVGGFNVSEQYQGDGVKTGWYDLGLRLASPIAVQLAAAFDEMFAQAAFRTRGVHRHRAVSKRDVTVEDGELLLSGPGRGRNPFTRSLRRDLQRAKTVQIIAAYFLPTWRIRHALMKAARDGGKVQLILPAKSDIMLSQLACRSLY
ncbi:MAG: Phospholipase D/Transphosphatidylase, partial [Pedosphaera sp.]|nr:Phospholipase D/Transphosphatidylase [Pedosphaera sp.]